MIILTHIGNTFPPYAYYSIAHLRKYNPLEEVHLIVDSYLQSDMFFKQCEKYHIKVIDSNQYSTDEQILILNQNTWIKQKHPKGPPTTYKSQDNFWHLTMERLFYINAHIKKHDLKEVFHIENDNCMFYPIGMAIPYTYGKITCVKRSHAGEDSTLFSFAFIPNSEQMNKICILINEFIKLGEAELQRMYGFDHISEMHLLSICRWMGLIDMFPNTPEQEYTFDPFGYAAYLFGTNNFQGPGFYDTSDNIGTLIAERKIQPVLIDKVPYVKTETGLHKIFNLHMHKKNIEEIL
jgi:hypothetical protein